MITQDEQKTDFPSTRRTSASTSEPLRLSPPFGIIRLIACYSKTLFKSIYAVTTSRNTKRQRANKKALIGAILFAALWYLLTYRLWHRRHPYYQRQAPV